MPDVNDLIKRLRSGDRYYLSSALAKEAVSALEALAGRQVAVTDEMVEAGCIAAKKAFSDKVLSGSLQQHMVRAILEAAPPAPQAADTRPGAANGSLRGERQATPTPPASGKVGAEAVAWTGSGSITAMEWGREGHIWPSKADAHPIPLFSEATVAAMQAEIERLMREAHVREIGLQTAGNRVRAAEAAEAELAKLRAFVELCRDGFFTCDDELKRAAARALLKGETVGQ